jgi:AcrR family transcriptional regulator
MSGREYNHILMSQNPILPTAKRIARRSLAEREIEYSEEVQRLLDAGLAVMQRCGTSSSPRVADIVSEAQVSNDAFYRHFASKEDLVLAVAAAGAERLESYVAYQMAKQTDPESMIATWIRCVLAQATDQTIAEPTRAVLWNAAAVTDRRRTDEIDVYSRLAQLLEPALQQMGSFEPTRDAVAITATIFTLMQRYLQERHEPSAVDLDHAINFCLRAISK